MSTDRDPNLQALFAHAEQELEADGFGDAVMAEINSARHRALLLWSIAGVVVEACLALIAAPLLAAVELATRLLPVSLVELESEWLRQLLAPINSVAAAVALGFLALRMFFRRIFR